jgi:hypothetical protein
MDHPPAGRSIDGRDAPRQMLRRRATQAAAPPWRHFLR